MAMSAAFSGTAPNEIGFLTRVGGLRVGLDELHSRLGSFVARVAGDPQIGQTREAPAPQGLDELHSPQGLNGELSTAEVRLRECMALLGKLNDAF